MLMTITVIATLAITIVAAVLFSVILREKERTLYQSNLDTLAGTFNYCIDSAEYEMQLAQWNTEIVDILQKTYRTKIRFHRAEVNAFVTLSSLTRFSNAIEGICMIGENGIVSSSKTYPITISSEKRKEWLAKGKNLREGQWSYEEEPPFLDNGYTRQLVLCSPVTDKVDGSFLGTLIVVVSDSVYESGLELNSGNSAVSFYGEEGRLISQVGGEKQFEELDSFSYEDGKTEYRIGNKTCFAQKLNNEWILVHQYDEMELVRSELVIITAIFLIFLACCAVMYFVGHRVSSRFTRRIVEMSRQVTAVGEGDLSVRMDESGEDEISSLARHFNYMLSYIEELMKKIKEDEKRLHQSEMRALQAQIKPHFLYNTLETISWLVRFKRHDDALEVIKALTTYFRCSLSGGEDIISLRKELAHVQSYITIQEYRYKDMCTFTVSLEPEIEKSLDDIRIPKLVLQPLVENALYHGVKENDGKGWIHITFRLSGQTIQIRVEDNGPGISIDKLAVINSRDRKSGGSYGIRNVDEKIRNYYGETFGLTYMSEAGVGTTAMITIPNVLSDRAGE